MQATIVFFVAMVCGALAAEPAKVEFKYAYPAAGAYPYAAAVAAPYAAYPYAAYPYSYTYPAGYTGYYPAVPVADAPAKAAEKTSEFAADQTDSKYFFTYPYAGYPYAYPVYQAKKE